jgi:3-methylcrotonyl-CoA carboxylase alpha subunit
MNGLLSRPLDFADDTNAYPLVLDYRAGGWLLHYQQQTVALNLTRRDGCDYALRLADEAVRGTVRRELAAGGDLFHVFSGGAHWVFNYTDPLAHAGTAEAEGGRLTAPMPGKIVALLVSKGERVEKGAPLLIMEAMKMEHTISAPGDGEVAELLYAVGDQVAEGAQLLSFKVV